MNKLTTRIIVFALATIFYIGLTTASAATFTVDRTDDVDVSACTMATNDCSLRGAIGAANAAATDDLINFDAAVFATAQTITLGGGQLVIANAGMLIINGTGAKILTIDVPGVQRHFELSGNAVVTINKLTMSGRKAYGVSSGGGIDIFFATLTLNDSVLINNSAQHGGAIRNGGIVRINNSTISGNSTTAGGGGILNSGESLEITNSTISNNSAVHSGGGIYNINGAKANLTNVTIFNNSVTNSGGGGGIDNSSGGGKVEVRNSIIANNTSRLAPDFSGTLISKGYNLIKDTNGTTITGSTTSNILGQDPQLLPLGNYGGATQTHALRPTSPAIDTADPNNFPATDQRGNPRPRDGDLNGTVLPDIGAFERHITIFTITKIADSNDGLCNADCSLREAIVAINAATTPDKEVVFNPVFFNTTRIITLTDGELQFNNTNGMLFVNGPGTNLLTISGNNQSRIFNVGAGADVTVSGVTLTAGNSTTNGGSIYNAGRLIVNNSTIIGNMAANFGGGIFNNDGAALNIFNSIISSNSANVGGGIFNFTNSNLTLFNSTVDDNSASSGYGGGVSNNAGTLTLNNSTVSGNKGGGIYNGGIANLNSSTVSGNTAPNGGGIFSDVLLNIISSTVANNTATNQGGGVYRNAGTVNVRNSIFADNIAVSAPDFSGTLTSQGFNLIENFSGANITGTTTGNILGVDPQLLPLGNYGGLTQTHALRANSPAIDKGNSFGITTDQRGQIRPYDFPNIPNIAGGNGADIGAFERQVNDQSSSTLFDFDGDGKSDISVFRPDNGVWYLLNSSSGFTATQFGISTDKIVPADYDGDGRTDVAVYRAGTWYLQRSAAGFTGIAFGEATDVPQPADFNGDGKADLAVFRPSNGVWYIYNLVTNQFSSVQFGQSEDIPVAADYDGDGKADVAVYRPSAGTWYVQRSRDGFTGFAFGTLTDKPVPADYDGDGKTDIAVFRLENGTWYLNRSRDGFTGFQFGLGTDKPVPADYDGDGKSDIAVFRDGIWYLQRSRDGFTGISFGTSTDKPVPNAFVLQ